MLKEKIFRETLKREIREKKLAAAKRMLEVNNLNNLLEKHSFDNFTAKENWQKKMLNIAKEYANNPSSWLLVSGQSGCGKTHVCTAVVNSLLAKSIPVLYMLWREDLSVLKSYSYSDAMQYKRLMNRYKSMDCLYIDDFFKAGHTEADIKIAFEILDARYRTNKLTIISTELTKDELMNVDEAIGGRIWQASKKILVKKDIKRNVRIAEVI